MRFVKKYLPNTTPLQGVSELRSQFFSGLPKMKPLKVMQSLLAELFAELLHPLSLYP